MTANPPEVKGFDRNAIEARLIRAEQATEIVDVIAWATGPAREDVRSLIEEVDRLAGKTAAEWRAEAREWLEGQWPKPPEHHCWGSDDPDRACDKACVDGWCQRQGA